MKDVAFYQMVVRWLPGDSENCFFTSLTPMLRLYKIFSRVSLADHNRSWSCLSSQILPNFLFAIITYLSQNYHTGPLFLQPWLSCCSSAAGCPATSSKTGSASSPTTVPMVGWTTRRRSNCFATCSRPPASPSASPSCASRSSTATGRDTSTSKVWSVEILHFNF